MAAVTHVGKIYPHKSADERRIVTSAYGGDYSATLYLYSVEENGSVSLEFLRSVSMQKNGTLKTRKSDGLVMLCDIADLNAALASAIHEGLAAQGHWLARESWMLRADPSYRLEIYGFFLAHPHFGSFEWYHLKPFIESSPAPLKTRFFVKRDFTDFIAFLAGRHKSKSVRKALFASYNESVEKNGNYNPKCDLIMCRSFDDPNLVCHLLSLPVRKVLFEDIDITVAIWFLRWLQRRYSAAAIVRSFSKSVEYTGNFFTPTWVNTMRMVSTLYAEFPHAMTRHFQKVPMNAKSIHDELIRINAHAIISKEGNVSYEYSDIEKGMAMVLVHLHFRLVCDKLELNLWGDMLHNCLFGFNYRIIKKYCYIIGVFANDALLYAVEFDGRTILQAYGKFNTDIPEDDYSIVVQWAALARNILKLDAIQLDAIA